MGLVALESFQYVQHYLKELLEKVSQLNICLYKPPWTSSEWAVLWQASNFMANIEYLVDKLETLVGDVDLFYKKRSRFC